MPDPRGSEPGYRRPVLVVQSDGFNESGIRTIIVVSITSNTRLANAPGNLLLSKRTGGLSQDSVVNVSQMSALDRRYFESKIGRLPPTAMAAIDEGLRLILQL